MPRASLLSFVIQSFADQFVLISLQEIEHEKKEKENGDLRLFFSSSFFYTERGRGEKMAMTCEEKIAKPNVLQKCDVMVFGGRNSLRAKSSYS